MMKIFKDLLLSKRISLIVITGLLLSGVGVSINIHTHKEVGKDVIINSEKEEEEVANKGPEITGLKDIEITAGEKLSLDRLGIKAIDNVDGELDLTFKETVDTNKPGTYEVEVSAVDKSGNKTTNFFSVLVKEDTKTVDTAKTSDELDVSKPDKRVEVSAPEPKLTNEEVAKLVIAGEFGNGSERRANLESKGYIFAEVQEEVNRLAPKPKPQPKPQTKPQTPSSNEQSAAPSYRANVVHMAGKAMPYKTSNYDNMGRDIDAARGSWVTSGDYPVFNPHDGKGTYFAAHNYYGGDTIMQLGYGSHIIVTDANGVPHTYVVDNILRDNKQEYFDDALSGRLDKEYIIFQTCEYPETRGNIHVFATKQ